MELCQKRKKIESKIFKFDLKAYFANVGYHKIDRPHYSGLESSFIQDKPLFAIEE